MEAEFATHKAQIKEQVQEAILARYLPESILRRLALETDPQARVKYMCMYMWVHACVL